MKTGGHLLFFGIPRAYGFAFDYETFFRKYCTTTSIAGAPFEPGLISFRLALDLIASGAIDVTPLLTHRLPFDRRRRPTRWHAIAATVRSRSSSKCRAIIGEA